MRQPIGTPGMAYALTILAMSGCLLGTSPEAPQKEFVGLVVASHPVAAEAGLQVLRAGGNAVDAAAAVQFALNVVEPMMSGIGGGAFLLLWDAEAQTLVALDGREVAPAAATADMFQAAMATGDDVPASERGIAVGVPGTLAVWDLALAEHGTVSLAEAMAPAIEAAESGFVVDEVTSGYIEWSIEKLRRWPAAATLLLDDVTCPPHAASQFAVGDELVIVPCRDGTPLAPGTSLRQPLLAAALRSIASDGPQALYNGELGEALVAAQASRGGRMTMQDLANYAVVRREPLVREWRDLSVATFGLPSGGLVLQESLAILEPMAAGPRTDPAAAHNAIEAIHLAFADRAAYFSDPATAGASAEQILSPAFIDERRGRIDPDRTGAPFPAGPLAAPAGRAERAQIASGHHTTHFTVMDQHGNIAAVTSTIESIFGSGIMVPEYGFFLNNELTDFDLEPGGPNEVAPGKRPLSSMTPTIVFDDAGPLLALGSPGGYTIHGTVLQVMLDVLVDGTPLQAAVDAPRWAAGRSAELLHDPGLDPTLRDGLAARGHQLGDPGRDIGGVQAIHRTSDGWIGAADPRRAGAVGSL